jgi:membrane fusion protein, adhesin transport system
MSKALQDVIFASTEPIDAGRRPMILSVLGGAFLLFWVWAAVATLEEQTHATGAFIASSRSQVVQAVDGGAIVELRVKQGDSVEAGQVIALLDPQRFQASNDEVAAKVLGLKANIARLEAEVAATSALPPAGAALAATVAAESAPAVVFPPEVLADPELVASQTSLMQQRQKALDEDLASLASSLRLAEQQLAALTRLARTGDASESEILNARSKVNELSGQLASRRNKYLQDSQAELSRASDELSQAEQQLSQRSAVLAATQIRAPMSGLVKNVRVTTIGGVMRPGEELLEIVPSDGPLIVEARVKPADVAFIRPGLPATIKLDAYDYTIYGAIKGKVSYVSPDTLTEDSRAGPITYYRVQIETDDARPLTLKGNPFDIIPGMTSNVTIRTGERTVANYLLKPLRRMASESLTER